MTTEGRLTLAALAVVLPMLVALAVVAVARSVLADLPLTRREAPGVIFVVDTSAMDVAFSYPESGVIVLNPRLALENPDLAGFALNHELAHVALGHRRAGVGSSSADEQELQADCRAAEFGRSMPRQRRAAVAFFSTRDGSLDRRRAEIITLCAGRKSP